MDSDDLFFAEWADSLANLMPLIQAIEERSAKIVEACWNAIVAALYLNYDTGQDFLPQFRQNKDKVTQLIRQTAAML